MSISRRTLFASLIAAPFFAGLAGAVTPALSQAIEVRGVGGVDIQSVDVRVLAIDLPSRTVQVESKGYQWRVTLPEEFGPLTNIRVRDRLQINRVQGALVSIEPAKRGAKPSVESTTSSNDGLFGNLPARWVVRKMVVTAKFTGLDSNARLLSYTGPEGSRTVPVVDPEVLAALKKVKKGSMIVLNYAEATEFILTQRR